MALIQARLSSEEERLVKEYTKARNISVSALIRDAIFEKIEEDIDLKLYEDAMRAHFTNPKEASFEEMVRMVNG